MHPMGGMFDGSWPVIGLALVVMASVAVMLVAMLWAARTAYRARARVWCPERGRRARVLFRLAPDGSRADVLRCSVFRRRGAVTCRKACLRSRFTALTV
jgi:hypothetical protein